jgi:3-oxoacyl-[acyl-carrier protein] reductase
LAGCSYDVCFTYVRKEEQAQQTAAACSAPARVKAVCCDVKQPDRAEALVRQVMQEWGRLDVLVNNAGIVRDRTATTMSDEEWTEVLNTNLHGAFYYCRAASRVFVRQQAGRIINITSVSGLCGIPGQVNYSSAKAGLTGMTKTLARELGPFNITVNAVAPGYVETEMIAHLAQPYRAHVKKLIALRRLGQPEEVACAVQFLASEEASYITGQILCVDGGGVGL